MPTSYFDKIIIADTSCLIVLTNIGKLDLLAQLCGTVLITPEIAGEYGTSLPEWIQVTAVIDPTKTSAFHQYLDLGASSAIALASETNNALLVLDDKKARTFAQRLGLEITGTLGLLRSAGQHGLIEDINPIIEKLKKHKFRMPPNIETYLYDG
ncbi:DUF3368 domain-containing protein [Spirochaetia bacterium]|nr:DUF3368 domain-containing protein [Spirochaetia bacterium]